MGHLGRSKVKARLFVRNAIEEINMLEIGLHDLLGYFSSLKSMVLCPAKKNWFINNNHYPQKCLFLKP
jgi:hypothetical protein